MVNVKEFYKKCVRVLKVTRKPNKQEFMTTVKMSALGILIVGLIGFVIYVGKILFFS